MSDHDELIKELIEEFFFEFLELSLSLEFVSLLDRSICLELDKELPEDLGPRRSHRADSVTKVQHNSFGPLLIHIEVASSQSSDFPERMFNNYLGLRKKYKLEVIPIAILTFKAPHKEQANVLSSTVAGLKVVQFEYKQIQLNRMFWQDFTATSNPVLCALMPLMRHSETERVEVKLASIVCLSHIAKRSGSELPISKIKIVQKFIDAYTPLLPSEENEFKARIKQLNPSLGRQL